MTNIMNLLIEIKNKLKRREMKDKCDCTDDKEFCDCQTEEKTVKFVSDVSLTEH